LKTGADDYMTKPFNRAILKAKIETILHNKDLQRNFHRDLLLQKSEPELPPTINDQFIQTINEVIKKNIASNNLTVEFLASETALSRVQLFRKMKSITGCSPSEYIKVVRLDHAATLLKECGLSVAETAYAVGFSDPKYFSTCFTEKFGVSPSQWAKTENK
jgi:transcriptional regulator GlxA family with amidase domain